MQSDSESDILMEKLSNYERDLIKSLTFAQKQLEEPLAPLEPIYDPILKQELEDKIEVLFQQENFYFYNAKGNDEDQEDDEIKRLISDCLSSKKCFIEYGNLEPIHHQEGERKIIVD